MRMFTCMCVTIHFLYAHSPNPTHSVCLHCSIQWVEKYLSVDSISLFYTGFWCHFSFDHSPFSIEVFSYQAFSRLATFISPSDMPWNSIISLFFWFSVSVSSKWFLSKVQCSELFSWLLNHFSHLALKVPGEKERMFWQI